jgi:D-alanine transaminase
LTGTVKPSVLIMSSLMDKDYVPGPATAVTLRDIRWERCDIKSISLLPNVLLRQQATDAGAYEAILIRNGYLTEGAASNVFAVIDGKICTPPLGPYLLPGITRDLILELCDQHRLPYEVRQISELELKAALEIWLTSSSREILPVVSLNDAALGDGQPGEYWSRIYHHYREFKHSVVQ